MSLVKSEVSNSTNVNNELNDEVFEDNIDKFKYWLKTLRYSNRTINIYTKIVKKIYKLYGKIIDPKDINEIVNVKNSIGLSKYTINMIINAICRYNEFLNSHDKINYELTKEFMEYLKYKYKTGNIYKVYQSYAKALIRYFGYIPRVTEIDKIDKLPVQQYAIRQFRSIVYKYEEFLNGKKLQFNKNKETSLLFENEFKEWMVKKGYTYTTYRSTIINLKTMYKKSVKLTKKGITSINDINFLYKNYTSKYRNKLRYSYKIYCEFLKEHIGICFNDNN